MSVVATTAIGTRIVSITPSAISNRFGLVDDGFLIEASGDIRHVRAAISADGTGHEFRFDSGEKWVRVLWPIDPRIAMVPGTKVQLHFSKARGECADFDWIAVIGEKAVRHHVLTLVAAKPYRIEHETQSISISLPSAIGTADSDKKYFVSVQVSKFPTCFWVKYVATGAEAAVVATGIAAAATPVAAETSDAAVGRPMTAPSSTNRHGDVSSKPKDPCWSFNLLPSLTGQELPVELTLAHRTGISKRMFVEFGGRGDKPQATYWSLSNSEATARIDFRGVQQWARIFFNTSVSDINGSGVVILKGQFRSPEQAKTALMIGLADDGGLKQGWRWRSGSKLQFEIGPEWTEFVALWQTTSKFGQTVHVLCHFEDKPVIEIANLQLAHCATDLAGEPKAAALSLRSVASPQPWQADAIVIPQASPPGKLQYIVAHVVNSEVNRHSWHVFNHYDRASSSCSTAIKRLGPQLTSMLVSAPVAPGSLVAVGTAQTGEIRIDLGHSPGLGLGAEIRSAFFEAGQLTVEAGFSISDADVVEGLLVELDADGLVIQTATITGPAGNECMPTVRLKVSCSARTAKRVLHLVIPSLKIMFAVGPLRNAPEPHVEPVPDVLATAHEVEGAFEGSRVTSSGTLLAVGWARDPSQPGAAVTVDVFLDDVPLASSRALSRRKDVSIKKGGSDIAGFSVEIPPNFRKGETISVTARARARHGVLTPATQDVRLSPFGYSTSLETKPMQALLARLPVRKLGATFAAVILTQDGADVLESLLESIQAFERNGFQRIIIIDHESLDETRNVIAAFSSQLPLEYIIRPRNSSFSESNNYGVSLCQEDVIFFVNNDIYLTAPIIGEVSRFMAPETGVVGVKLFDPPIPDSLFVDQAPQHVGVHFDPAAPGGVRPFESRLLTDCPQANFKAVQVPAATAALIAMDRTVFTDLGGFDEKYFYGWEDVDLCLRSLEAGKVNISINSVSAVHVRAHSRRKMRASVTERRNRNGTYFAGLWSYALRRSLRSQQLVGDGFWTGRKLHFGFVVSDFGPEATAGDYITALDFARAMERAIPSRSFFFKMNEPVDANAIDYLIVMTDDFDVRKVTGLGATAVVVGWARNWFHRWVSRPWRERFDIWFASSEHARRYMEEELCRSVALLRIGTDICRFSKRGAFDPKLASEVAFTGQFFWGSPREAVSILDGALGLNIRFFGEGWDAHPGASHFWGGVLPYDRMVDVYKSTKVVIDDSNFVTASWGSLNNRVFDSLAAGALVLTNNAIGVAEAFPDILPTYSSKETLAELLQLYVNDDARRTEVTAKARALVMEHHTYDVRAREFLVAARKWDSNGLRVAIKIDCPKMEFSDGCGNWHFANSLRRELEVHGHAVRIDCLDEWYGSHAASDDVCLTLRGLNRYQPKPGQINLLWIISHPDKVTVEEINSYDRCFAASAGFVRTFADLAICPISVLPLCTDSRIFFPGDSAVGQDLASQPVVFVGSSRKVSRSVVSAGVDLQVHEVGWADLLPEHIVKSQIVQNDELGNLYRRARVVLYDHCEDMRRWGFVSSRIFDAVACGRPVISDDCNEIASYFGNTVMTLKQGESFLDAFSHATSAAVSQDALCAAAEQVLAEHTFATRAEFLDSIIRNLDRERGRLNGRRAND